MRFETISVIGLGYIGLPTAAMFASRGVKVVGVDISEHVVNTINDGIVHIVEPGLGQIVEKVVNQKNLKATYEPEKADAFLITVPTPLKTSQKDIPEPDLSYIKSACALIAPVLEAGNLIVLESTSPVGTTEQICDWLFDLRPDLVFPNSRTSTPDVFIAYCPERVLPGKIIHELVHNDRIIGGITPKCSETAQGLYNILVEGDCHITSARTAEMSKLTENASRDVQIAFANELSLICDELDIDVWELIRLSNRHPRVNILQPGPGVGGHCIAVDPWFIAYQSPDTSKIIQMSRLVNDSKPLWVIKKIELALENLLIQNPSMRSSEITIACYGLTFKADIDDLRESPAHSIASEVRKIHSGNLLLVDPNVKQLPKNLKGAKLTDFEDALRIADIHILLVDHAEFKNNQPSAGVIIDTKGIWSDASPSSL